MFPNKSSKHWYTNTPSNESNISKSPAKSSSEAIKSGSNKTPITGKNNHQNNKHLQQPKEQPDDRLFLRLSNDNPLRTYSGFALLAYIKTKLSSDKELIKDVLPTKTGFALCPSKGSMKALEEKISAGKICAEVPIEKASPWTSYRISNVPRKFGTIDDNFQHILAPVTSESISEAIISAAGVRPVSITPSKDNAEFPDSPSTTWIVRLPEAHNRLPRTLFLFGCRTTSRILPPRSAVIQCSRCWLWHNSRVYASPPRCRLCGSTQHSEAGHANQCAAPHGHICPPKCIHCYGPHPSDDSNCEICPIPSRTPKTKTQINAIRRINTEARLRSQAEAGCIRLSSNSQAEKVGPTSTEETHQNRTSVTTKSSDSSPSPIIPKSVNLFEVLSNVVEPNANQMES